MTKCEVFKSLQSKDCGSFIEIVEICLIVIYKNRTGELVLNSNNFYLLTFFVGKPKYTG